MNKPLKLNKTLNITVDGKGIMVEALPAEIRFEIETLDAMMQRVRDIEFDYEIATIAARAKQVHVEKLLRDIFTQPKEPEQETVEPSVE